MLGCPGSVKSTDKNALIVFTSDHGDMLGERNYRFTKYCLYDSSVRVPVILSVLMHLACTSTGFPVGRG
jgi:arylsulfatase A-like enzyme